MPRGRGPRFLVVCALAAAGAVGCESVGNGPAPAPKGAVAPLRAATRVHYQLGGPLRGPRAPGTLLGPESTAPGAALLLDVSMLALAAPPPGWTLSAVSSQTRVVMTRTQEGDALRATPRHLGEARAGLLDGTAAQLADAAATDSAARGRLLSSERACLVPGATTVLELVRDEPPEHPGVPRHERVALLLGRRPDGSSVNVAIALERADGFRELVEITASVFSPDALGQSLVALVPSPFGDQEEARWLAFVAHAKAAPVGASPGAAAHEEVVGLAVRDLAAQAETARLAATPPAPLPELPDLVAIRKALLDRTTARRGLYALGSTTGARTAEALAIASDDHTLAPIASAVAAAIGSFTRVAKAAELGIALEHATLAACRQALVTDPVPEDLPDTLEWRGGAALRLLASLAPELERAKTLPELERTIEDLNIRLLLDASPMVRARAARWLAPRVSLEGYSALAPSGERRAAVEKITRSRTEAPRGSR